MNHKESILERLPIMDENIVPEIVPPKEGSSYSIHRQAIPVIAVRQKVVLKDHVA